MDENRSRWDAWRRAEDSRSFENGHQTFASESYQKNSFEQKELDVQGNRETVLLKALDVANDEIIELRAIIKKLHEQVVEAQHSQKPDHIRLFMMTPFDKAYKPVEEAMRKVFEQKPFWFEVRLARDYYDAATLVKNVQSHIASAHGFLAEISELSENVMMEVGGVLLSGDERPLFAIRFHSAKKPPVDFGDLLTFTYERGNISPDIIAGKFKKQIFTDGRLSNAELRKLCEERDKQSLKHYLSRTLLRGLVAQGIKWKKQDIEKICNKYDAVEAFLEADENALTALNTSAPPSLLKAAQEVLRGQMEGSHGG